MRLKSVRSETYGIFFASKIRQIRWEKGQNLELIKVTSFEWSKIGQLELASKCCVHKAMICFNANAWWTNKRLLCELGSFIVNIWVMSNRKWQWNYLHNLIINVITFICIIFEKRSEGGRRPTEQSVFRKLNIFEKKKIKEASLEIILKNILLFVKLTWKHEISIFPKCLVVCLAAKLVTSSRFYSNHASLARSVPFFDERATPCVYFLLIVWPNSLIIFWCCLSFVGGPSRDF